MGQYAEARAHLSEADRILRAAFGDRHVRVAMNRVKLGLLAQDQSNWDEAIALYRDSLDMFFE